MACDRTRSSRGLFRERESCVLSGPRLMGAAIGRTFGGMRLGLAFLVLSVTDPAAAQKARDATNALDRSVHDFVYTNLSLDEILTDIQQRFDVEVLVADPFVGSSRSMDVNMRGVSLESALKGLLGGDDSLEFDRRLGSTFILRRVRPSAPTGPAPDEFEKLASKGVLLVSPDPTVLPPLGEDTYSVQVPYAVRGSYTLMRTGTKDVTLEWTAAAAEYLVFGYRVSSVPGDDGRRLTAIALSYGARTKEGTVEFEPSDRIGITRSTFRIDGADGADSMLSPISLAVLGSSYRLVRYSSRATGWSCELWVRLDRASASTSDSQRESGVSPANSR